MHVFLVAMPFVPSSFLLLLLVRLLGWQVSPWDCTGCELCVRICPADALKLADAAKVIEARPPFPQLSCLESNLP